VIARRARRLVWTERAIADLEAIESYIAAENQAAARRWIDKLLAAAKRMTKVPLSGRRVPEIGRDDVRETRLRTYRIVYRVTATQLDVLTVFEGHRLFPSDVVVPDR